MERLEDALEVYDEFLDNYHLMKKLKKIEMNYLIKLINNIISSLFFVKY